MKSINKVVLSGRITKDIELRAFASGSSYCQITLAVNDNVKKQNRMELNK